MICKLCNEDVGVQPITDEWIESHLYDCDSKEARAVIKARDDDCGRMYCDCCQ